MALSDLEAVEIAFVSLSLRDSVTFRHRYNLENIKLKLSNILQNVNWFLLQNTLIVGEAPDYPPSFEFKLSHHLYRKNANAVVQMPTVFCRPL